MTTEMQPTATPAEHEEDLAEQEAREHGLSAQTRDVLHAQMKQELREERLARLQAKADQTNDTLLREWLFALIALVKKQPAIEQAAQEAYDAYLPHKQAQQWLYEDISRLEQAIYERGIGQPIRWQSVRKVLREANLPLTVQGDWFADGLLVRKEDSCTVSVTWVSKHPAWSARHHIVAQTKERALEEAEKVLIAAGYSVVESLSRLRVTKPHQVK